MKFVTRAQWGAAYAKGSGPIAGPVLGVTCHWEGPHVGTFAHDVCARKVKTIERFHAVDRGWSGIAYNLVVCPHGSVFEGRGVGVRSAANGTSSIGGNDQWYAVCYLGGVGDGFTAEGKQGMADAIGYLRDNGAGAQVNGHRDHHATECPGDEIYAWVKTGAPTTTAPTTSEEDDMQLSDNIYPGKKDDKTVGQVLQDLDRLLPALNAYRAGAVRRHQALQKLVREAIAAADRGATPAEVRALLENLDATIQIVIADDATEEK